MTTVGWILNLDADLELADPDGFAPSSRLVQQTQAMAERLLATARAATTAVRHVLLEAGCEPTFCQSWCPTPRAQQAAHELGFELPAMPSLQTIRRVNHRSFAAGLGIVLPGAAYVTSLAELDDLLAGTNPANGWLLKRPFGFSGRSQKRVTGALTGGDRRWAEASMTQYGRGLMVEPFVAIEEEFALHSWLGRDGACLTGQPTRLATDAGGAWLASTPAPDMDEHERAQLHAAHEKAAKALVEVGYFGPFSTDAFRYRVAGGQSCFHALGELNARYSMGFFVGFAARLEQWAKAVSADELNRGPASRGGA